MKVAIVEDDRESAQDLKRSLQKYQLEIRENMEVVCFYNGLNFIEEYTADYDFVFMDIEMPLLNGMEAAKRLRERDAGVDIVFLTAMSQYAILGYDVGAAAFLVKPVSESDLYTKLQRIIDRRRRNKDVFLIFLKDSQHIKIPCRDIVYVESSNHYCIFHTEGGEFRKLISLREVEKILSGKGFIRSSNSFLVNVAYVSGWGKDKVIANGVEIPISRSMRKGFMDELTRLF